MVVAEYVESEIVDLVVHAQLVFRIHVVVDRSAARAGDARLAIAEDAALRANCIGRIRNPKEALHTAIPPCQDAAHFLRIALPGVRDQLLTECLWELQAVSHQLSAASFSAISSTLRRRRPLSLQAC